MSKTRNIIKKFYQKIKEFLKDEYAGNIVEYALLIGFALFVFFIIVGVVTSMLNWTVDQSNGFFEMMEELNGYILWFI
ncbi:MAG: hypothetical protein EU548_08140 [Promethearchaeota archaeon]|nr:MAG: hypothetical protein EU548_08140 [Candidatus Lokiarchaeota archaeon]